MESSKKGYDSQISKVIKADEIIGKRNTTDSVFASFNTTPQNIKATNVNSEKVCLFAKWSTTLNSYLDPILLKDNPTNIKKYQC